MNKKISLGLAISMIIITAAASFAITMAYSQKIFNNLLPNLSDRVERRYELNDIESVINDKFYYQAIIDNKALNISLAKGYITGLGDPYSRYLTADQYTDYIDKIEGKIHGIGVIAAYNEDSNKIYVLDIAPGSPAAIEGVSVGDEIISIENEAVTKNNYQTLLSKLQGLSLKTVTLIYRHAGTDKTVNLMIGYDVQNVSYSEYGTAGYIKINSFYKNTPVQLENAIKELKAKNVTAIIFDVRNTSEGTIKYAANTIDIIVPLATQATKVIATATDNKGKTTTFPSDAKELTMPMAVLVNENTSGCAELFAVSLSDFKNSPLVGAKTKGNDTMQEVERLQDGGAIVLTVAKVTPYITPSYAGGLQPLYGIALTEDQSKNFAQLALADDPQFAAALNLFVKV